MSDDLEKVNTVNTARGDLEVGATDAIQKHFSRQVVARKAVTQRKLDFERSRPRWLRECIAEAAGVFFYVYPGIATTTSFILAAADPSTHSDVPAAYSNFLQIGLSYGIGIAFAIIVFAPTSGGHFNPAVTLNLAYWQGFPWKKVPHFIFSQIFGAFMAGLIMMGQYNEQINQLEKASLAAGKGYVFNGGPASTLVTIPSPDQTNLGYLFLIEFFVDSFIALVIWANLDPANPFVSGASAPYNIGFAFTVMIWSFAPVSIGTNMARDLGCRIVAAIWYGGEAFSYDHYSWIPILVNVPAYFFATFFYEAVCRDSLSKIGKGAAKHEGGEEALVRHLTREGIVDGSGIVQGDRES